MVARSLGEVISSNSVVVQAALLGQPHTVAQFALSLCDHGEQPPPPPPLNGAG